jgi:hypothetical protein
MLDLNKLHDKRRKIMRLSKLTAALSTMAVACLALCGSGFAQNDNLTFAMVPTLGVQSCVPAKGRVTITHTLTLVENMHVEVSGCPRTRILICSLFKFRRVPLAFPGTWAICLPMHMA